MKIFGWSPLFWKGNKQCKHRNEHVCLRDWRVTIKIKQRKGKVKTLRTTLKETGKIRKKITVYNRKRIHRGVRESKWQGKDNESELTKVGFEREASLISGSLSNVGFCFLFCFVFWMPSEGKGEILFAMLSQKENLWVCQNQEDALKFVFVIIKQTCEWTHIDFIIIYLQ